LDLITITPEISAEEGIRQIRQLIGKWLSNENVTPQQTVASVANVLLGTRLGPDESNDRNADA
jgi:hypothetical protein